MNIFRNEEGHLEVAYPDLGNLLKILTDIHGELGPRERALAFLAYSLGGMDALAMQEQYEKGKPHE